MWAFLLIFLAIYGAMNAYFCVKVSQAFVHGALGRLILAAAVAALVASPFVIRWLDRGGHPHPARLLGLFGYTWMAVVFWFLCLGVVGDLWNLGVRGAALAAPSARGLLLPARATVGAVGAITAIALVGGVMEAQAIRTRTITLSAERLPAASRPITLAVLSDLHLGTSTDGLRLNSALAIVRRVRPDAIICLGDLFDSAGGNIDGYADRLAALEAPLGKFAILGNHEFYAGLTDSLAFHRRAGFRVLRAEAVDLTEGLRLAGVDDPAGHPRGWSSRADEQALLPSEKRAFTILLKHRPDVNDDLAGRFDLQLSGHTHGGQFFPFLLITAKQFRFYRGFHPLPDGASVYVSCGSGTWGPPVRLLAPPEVTIICIRPPRHP